MTEYVMVKLKRWNKLAEQYDQMEAQLAEVRDIMVDEHYLDDQRAMNRALHEVLGLGVSPRFAQFPQAES